MGFYPIADFIFGDFKMPKIQYVKRKKFKKASRETIAQAIVIVEEYQKKGLTLTIRQLYYQFVARRLCKNHISQYNRLSRLINDARLCGLIDWYAIIDRTRSLSANGHWDDPREILESCAPGYNVDKWEEQEVRPEIWIEKDAAIGIIDRVCRKNDVPYFSTRGFPSQTSIWRAAMRLKRYINNGQEPPYFSYRRS